MSGTVLEVRNLCVEVPGANGPVRLVEDVSFEVRRGEVFGLVGESGSGKSLTMLAVLGLLPAPLRLAGGSIRLHGREIAAASFAEMRKLRGKTVSMIFQDPMTSLNPVRRVGSQIDEAIRLHNPDWNRARIRDRSIALMDMVGIPNPAWRYRQFPNEFSGGMRQRVMIAIAMANDPDLLIADEPTTALDVTIQAQVMGVLADVRRRTGAAMVLITHDLGLVAETADRIAVMYAGRLMEQCPADTIFTAPSHPYTAGLEASLPDLEHESAALYSIPGNVPDPSQRPPGCPFHPRCAVSAGRARCAEERPAMRPTGAGRLAACHFAEETPDWARARRAEMVQAERRVEKAAGEPVLCVENLVKTFRVRRHWRRETLMALRGVSFAIAKGRTLGLVGESGCGKSTLGRAVLRLFEVSGGRIAVNGEDMTHASGSRLRARRRDLQVVFQDPYSSLDPRFTVHEVIAEPLRIQGRYSPEQVHALLQHVGLSPEAGRRRPGQFSGGQRQRIAIARALALHPDILILDEAVSALDVSIQAQIINLLQSLQAELGLTYLFISHDLSVVRHISDEVAVMYLGSIVEIGPTRRVFEAPAHPYTAALLAAVPHPGRVRADTAPAARGEIPDPLSPPSGCAFRTRCPKAAERCAQAAPELLPRTEPGHLSACHFALTPKEEFAAA
jgi:peptide/nickel transport system ATP-binding protein